MQKKSNGHHFVAVFAEAIALAFMESIVELPSWHSSLSTLRPHRVAHIIPNLAALTPPPTRHRGIAALAQATCAPVGSKLSDCHAPLEPHRK